MKNYVISDKELKERFEALVNIGAIKLSKRPKISSGIATYFIEGKKPVALLGSTKNFSCPSILSFAIEDIKKQYPELGDFLIVPSGEELDKLMDLKGKTVKLYVGVDDE